MMKVIKGVKIRTPVDQKTYNQLVSEPHVALTRINEMFSYSRYRTRRHDDDDIYGPNFEDEESYYRFLNERNNHQYFDGNSDFNYETGSYRDAYSDYHYSGEFARPARLRQPDPSYHRYAPYPYRGTQYRPPFRGRQRGHSTFAIPKGLPPKKWKPPSGPSCEQVLKSRVPSVQSAKVNSSEDAIVKDSSCSDSLCSPVQKTTSVPSCETVPKSGSPTEETAKVVDASDVKTECNTTMEMETVCFEAPAVEDIVDFIGNEEGVQMTNDETCKSASIKVELEPMATSTPTYESIVKASNRPVILVPDKLSAPDFIIDKNASYLPKTPPSESKKGLEERTKETTVKNNLDTTKTVDVSGEKSPENNVKDPPSESKKEFEGKAKETTVKNQSDTTKMVNGASEKSLGNKLSAPECPSNVKPPPTPSEPKKKKNEERADETTVKSKCDTNVAGKTLRTNGNNNKEKICVKRSTSKRRISGASSSVKSKFAKLDVSSTKASSSSGRSKETSNAFSKENKDVSTCSNKTSKMDEARSKKSNEDLVHKSTKTSDLQSKKTTENEPPKSNGINKIRILENVRLNNKDVGKSNITKAGQTSPRENQIGSPKEDNVRKPKQIEKDHKPQQNKPSNTKNNDYGSKNKQTHSAEPKHPRRDRDYNNAPKKVPNLQNGNNDKGNKLDKGQTQSSESTKTQKDLTVTVKEPQRVPEACNTILLAEKPVTPPKQQEILPIVTAEERKAVNTMENNDKSEFIKKSLYRRKSVDLGVLSHRNELSAIQRKRRAKSVGPITDVGDFFTGFRLTRSKSQELGATLITDVVNFSREHKKLNLQNIKSDSSRRTSDCVQDQNTIRDIINFNPFKLINVSGSLAKDPRLNRNANPQLLTKEKFMESMCQSGSLSGLKDYRFNFEKSPTLNYDKIDYVGTKPTSLLKSPLHEHLSFSIESNSRAVANGDSKKSPRETLLKSSNVSPLPVINNKKGNSEVAKVYLNPASPPNPTKAPRNKCSELQPSKPKNALGKSEGPKFAKRESLFRTSPSKAFSSHNTKNDKCCKSANTATTFTNNNPIAKRKRRGRRGKKNGATIPQNVVSGCNAQNVNKTTIHPASKLKLNELKPTNFDAATKKKNNPVLNRKVQPHQTDLRPSKSDNVPITTSAILKDCLLHEDIDKYFPSNNVKGSSMVLNVGDVSILMTEKGCKKVSHESVETIVDEQWQKVEEFLTPKPSNAKTSVFKGATDEIDRDMSLHEVIGPENIIPVKRSSPVPILPKPVAEIGTTNLTLKSLLTNTTVIGQNGFGSGNMTVTLITPAIDQNSSGSNSIILTPVLTKPSAAYENNFGSNGLNVTSIPQNTLPVAENNFERQKTPVRIIAESGVENNNEERILPILIPSKSTALAESSFGVENVNEKCTVLAPTPSEPTANVAGTVPTSTPLNATGVVENVGLKNTNGNQTVRLPSLSTPTAVVVDSGFGVENVTERAVSVPFAVIKHNFRSENTNEKRIVRPPIESIPTVVTEGGFGSANVNVMSIPPKTATVAGFGNQPSILQNPKESVTNTLQAVVTQIGCNNGNQPAVNFSVPLPIVAQQPSVNRVSHRDLAVGLVPFIYRLLIYKNERYTFKTVREKMNSKMVAKETVIADWKILTDAYVCTFQTVGNQMISYLKGVEVKRFQLGLLFKEIENFFRNNGFSSVTQPMILFSMYDIFVLCKPISESEFLDKMWKDVEQYATYLMKLKAQQSSSNAPSQQHVPTTLNRQNPTVNNHQIDSISLSSNTIPTNNSVVVNTSVSNYSQMSNAPRILSSVTHVSNQRLPNIYQNGGYIIHNYSSSNNCNQFNVQNPQIRDITTNNVANLAKSSNNNLVANKFVSRSNNNKKQLPNMQQYSQISKQNAVNQQSSHNPSNYGYLQRSDTLPGQGQERQSPQQNVTLAPPPSYLQPIPSASMGSINPYHNQSVMYNSVYQQNSQRGSAHVQNVGSQNQYDHSSNYRNPPRQNVLNNYNSSVHVQPHMSLGRQVGCSTYPPQNSAPSHSYFHSTVYPPTLPQHSTFSGIPSMQNSVRNNYNHPESTFQSHVNERSKKENKTFDNSRNLHLPRIAPPVSQTYPVHNSLPIQHVSAPSPSEASNSIVSPVRQQMMSPQSQQSQCLPTIQPPASQTLYPVHNPMSTQNVSAPPPSEASNSIVNSVPQQLLVAPQKSQFLLSDLLRSHQFPLSPTPISVALDKPNPADFPGRSDISDKDGSTEQRHCQVTSSPPVTEKDISSQQPPANPADNFKIYLPPRSSADTTNKEAQPEGPVSSEEVPAANVHGTSSNDDIVKISDSEEEEDEGEVEPEYISIEKWVIMNQEVIDLEDYDDIFEPKYLKQDIKNEMNNDGYEESVTVEEFPPEVSSPDSGICTPKGDELNICFCGVKAAFVCSCRSVIYCSRRCQEVDWDSHQKDCKSQ